MANIDATEAKALWIENTQPDGYYSTIHDAANALYNDDAPIVGQQKTTAGANYYWYMTRGGLIFPLASVSGVTVTSAALYLYGSSDFSVTDFDVTIVSGAGLQSPLALADYGDLLSYTASWGSINTATCQENAWNVINLNATAIAALQAAIDASDTNFFLGLRSSLDISSTEPTADVTEHFAFYGLTTPSSGKTPYLSIPTTTFIPKIFIV